MERNDIMKKSRFENITLLDIAVVFMSMFLFGMADSPFNKKDEGFAFIPAVVIITVIAALIIICYKRGGIPSLVVRVVMSIVYADFITAVVVKPIANGKNLIVAIAFIVLAIGFAAAHGVHHYLKGMLDVKKERDTNVEIPPEERN